MQSPADDFAPSAYRSGIDYTLTTGDGAHVVTLRDANATLPRLLAERIATAHGVKVCSKSSNGRYAEQPAPVCG